MAITHIGSNYAWLNTGAGATFTVARPAGTTTGDIVVALIGTNKNNLAPVESGWTLHHTTTSGSTIEGGVIQRLYTRKVAAGDPTSYGWKNTDSMSNLIGVNYSVYRGEYDLRVDKTAQWSAASDVSNDIIAPSITPAQAPSMVVFMFGSAKDADTALNVNPKEGGTKVIYHEVWGGTVGYTQNLSHQTVTSTAATGTRAITTHVYFPKAGNTVNLIDVNTAPTAPGAFTDPTAGEVHNLTVDYVHGAGSDVDGNLTGYDVEYSTNNGSTWTRWASNRAATSGTMDSSAWPATTTAKIRARSVDSAGAVSAWTESPAFTIEHNKAPNAPPIIGPKNNAIIDRTQSQVFDWDFSDPDAGDSQSQYQRQWRAAGATTWTVETAVTSTATQRTDAGGFWAAGDWEWQVRTADAQGVWGPYSASAFFTAADPPAAPSITDPANGATIASESGQVVWSTPSQDSLQVRKIKDNAGSPDATTIYYDSGEIVSASARNHGLTFPVNDRTEHIQVRIKSSGLWSAWASVRVVVSYTPPAVPTFTLSPTPGSGLIALAIDNGAWPVSVGTVTYTGTGTGTITGPTATDGVTQSHNWTATLVTAAANGGTFDVAVDGVVVGQAVVGTQFTYEGLSFTINDGATDFAVGDKFSWATTAVKTNSNHILRRRSSELEWERIATEIAANSTYNDRTPASEIIYEYLVRAIGDNGTSSDSGISSASVTLHFMWLHLANDPAGTIRQFQFNNSGGTEIHTEEVEFLTFAGRKYPVAEFGEHETDSVVVDLDMAEEGELAYIRSLIRARSTICYRDSSGRKLFGIIPQQSIDSRFYGGTTSLEIRAIDYSEEV